MKTTQLILMTALHLMTTTVAVGEETSDRIVLMFIFDTRWSCGDDLPELRTLARQGFDALQLGDCVEIITAHPSRPRLRLAQTVYRNTASQVNTVNSVLAGIHEGFLSSAQVSRALAMALDRLESTCAKEDYKKAVVIVFSDGHLDDSDVTGVLNLAGEFKKRNWPLYITGDGNTNRNLLIAANRGAIKWVSSDEANPALWLRQARASLQPKPADSSTAKRPQETKTAPPATAAPTPSTLGETPLRGLPQPSYLPPGGPELGLTPGGQRQPQDITTRSRTEAEVTSSGGTSPAPARRPVEPSAEKKAPVVPNAAVEPNQAPRTAKGDKTDEQHALSKPKRPTSGGVNRSLGRFWPWLLTGTVALLVSVSGYTVARDGRKAEQIRKRLQGYLQTKRSSNDGMVVATINGQTRHLGRFSRLRPFYVGSGVKNALRITGKGISDRHLCLYRKAGKLMVQNVSGKPIAVGGLAVEPKAKRPLALPAVIELAENITLRLAVLRANDGTPGPRSDSHDQNRQQ